MGKNSKTKEGQRTSFSLRNFSYSKSKGSIRETSRIIRTENATSKEN